MEVYFILSEMFECFPSQLFALLFMKSCVQDRVVVSLGNSNYNINSSIHRTFNRSINHQLQSVQNDYTLNNNKRLESKSRESNRPVVLSPSVQAFRAQASKRPDIQSPSVKTIHSGSSFSGMFTERHLYQSLFFNKVAGHSPYYQQSIAVVKRQTLTVETSLCIRVVAIF